MNPRVFLACALVSALFAGCVSVRPLIGAEQIPADQRVTLIVNDKVVGIYKVDGAHRGYGFVEKFEIRPGFHTLTYTGVTNGYMVGTTIAQFALGYDFQPGHTYVIGPDPGRGAFAVQVVDQQTGDVLAPSPVGR